MLPTSAPRSFVAIRGAAFDWLHALSQHGPGVAVSTPDGIQTWTYQESGLWTEGRSALTTSALATWFMGDAVYQLL